MAEKEPFAESLEAGLAGFGKDSAIVGGDNGGHQGESIPKIDPRAALSDGSVTSIDTQLKITREVYVSEGPTFADIEEQIRQTREIATRIVPVEEDLDALSRIRRFADFKRQRRAFSFARLFSRGFYTDFRQYEQPLTETLADIEAEIKSDSKEGDLRKALLSLRKLTDEVNIKIQRLNSTFIGLVYSLTTSKELVWDLVQRIGHRELRDEAKVHSGIVAQLVGRLESEDLAKNEPHVFSKEFPGAIGIMIELEQRKLAVEELVHKDRKRRQWTVGIVIGYIALVLALAVFVSVRWRSRFLMGEGPLSGMRLPLVGIPWPVIVWSLIGSFAAMIYRFNKKPIYDFGDAVKWMLTRPVQGVVLGSAFYLVLISGLFLLGGRGTENPASNTANDVVLILSFLVGFSDRFADSVFNAIVDKYSQSRGTTTPDAERTEDKSEQRKRSAH